MTHARLTPSFLQISATVRISQTVHTSRPYSEIAGSNALRWQVLVLETVSDNILIHALAASALPFRGEGAIRDRT